MRINMDKLRSVSDTKLTQLNTEAAKLLKQNVWPVGKITKPLAQQMYKATSKLLDEYHKNVNKRCDELHKEFVTKKLPENLLTKQNNNAKLYNTNETINHSNRRNTMKLNTTEITANIEQLTNKVNELLERIAVLEGRKAETHNFKKLRERNHEEAPKSVKVEPKKVVKKANKEQKAEIVKLQKKAQEGKKLLTKKQLAQYTRLWHAKWQEVNKTIDINDKAARSLAFAKGRISCLKKARTY